jgi:hypothetical protein
MRKSDSKALAVAPEKGGRVINRRTPWVVTERGYVIRPGTNFRIWSLKDWDSNCLYLSTPVQACQAGSFDLVREEFLLRMNRLAALLKIQILAYCLMPGTIHLVVRVPDRKPLIAPFLGPAGEAALLEHMATYDSEVRALFWKKRLETLRAQGKKAEAKNLLRKYVKRIGSVSDFMKELKFAMKRSPRFQPLDSLQWVRRYTSWLVEDRHPQATKATDSGASRTALRLLAVHLELMPIREELVNQPSAYRWTSWGAALRGDKAAIAGICDLVGCSVKQWQTHGKPTYESWLRGNPSTKEPHSERVARAVGFLTVPLAIGFPNFVREMEAAWFRRFGKGTGKAPNRG